ncbi:hypothetical protein [Shewanella colwelliana]|uniref:hypothetical protein n=1 Tax=Shewanella colwelliana TaxID=23 RepID=UPI0022AF833F|nr:hypothetical protein [Shewanella colwelliana]MCZ4336401.1 hypothetical protein [Shewanella colwelliana]
MLNLKWFSTMVSSFLLFASMNGAYAADPNWMVGNWIPNDKDVLSKLLIEKHEDGIRLEAWRECAKGICYLGRVQGVQSSKIISANFTNTFIHAKFSTPKDTISLAMEDRRKSATLNVEISVVNTDATTNKTATYTFRKEEEIGQPPCACVFDKNRMYNPDKIVWHGEDWECAVYKDDGHCEKVQKIHPSTTK